MYRKNVFQNRIAKIRKLYLTLSDKIKIRLNEFKQLWQEGNDAAIFTELVFCILTPQSKAKTCFKCVENILYKNLLLKGDENQFAKELKGVRFKYKKAKYIIEARKKFLKKGKLSIKRQIAQFCDVHKTRDWLVAYIKGIGYKEASHFLRNIGLGNELAILDRHILKNLQWLGVIEDVPNALSKKKYLEIENRMKNFAEKIRIPISHLDFVLWYKETGEIFK